MTSKIIVYSFNDSFSSQACVCGAHGQILSIHLTLPPPQNPLIYYKIDDCGLDGNGNGKLYELLPCTFISADCSSLAH